MPNPEEHPEPTDHNTPFPQSVNIESANSTVAFSKRTSYDAQLSDPTNDQSNKVKYRFFYHRLYNCLCFIEKENQKLLDAIQKKERVTGQVKRLDELLDEFAFKVANKKESFEKEQIVHATIEGQQAFMAKRWKMRYQTLLEIVSMFHQKLGMLNLTDQHGDKYDTASLVDGFFDDAVSLPWEPNLPGCAWTDDAAVEDIMYDSSRTKSNVSRRTSSYEYNDLTIPISSVFIQDLLANHNLCNEQLKQQNDEKYRLFHVLSKTKEQRNELKKCAIEQENEIQAVKKEIQNVESAIANDVPDARQQMPNVRTTQPDTVAKPVVNNPATESPRTLDSLKEKIEALEYRKLELEGMLSEEEEQRKILMKRLNKLVGTIHVTCRLKPHRDSYLQVISDDKLLIPNCSPNPTSSPADGAVEQNDFRCMIFDKVITSASDQYGEVLRKLVRPSSMFLTGKQLCILVHGAKDSGKSFTLFGTMGSHSAAGVIHSVFSRVVFLSNQNGSSKDYQLGIRVLTVNDDGAMDLLKDSQFSQLETVAATMDVDDPCPQARLVKFNGDLELDHILQTVRQVYRNLTFQCHLFIQIIITKLSQPTIGERIQSILTFVELKHSFASDDTDVNRLNAKRCPQSMIENNSFRRKVPSDSNSMSGHGVHKSLDALSKAFISLKKRKVPSYTDTALTCLLKPVFVGDADCFLIVTVDSDPSVFHETEATLHLAHLATQATLRNNLDLNPKRSSASILNRDETTLSTTEEEEEFY